ncbi:MAG: hypothetical protein QOD49_1669, partial [Actinomycetota bacterium]|nr:hypothetical protein [Actinomycetota bacterium]
MDPAMHQHVVVGGSQWTPRIFFV